MAGTITPAVRGLASWKRLITIYTVTQIAGAAATGVLLASIGMLIAVIVPWRTSIFLAALAVLAATGALHDLRLLPFSFPSSRWQVPQRWKGFRPSIMAACYGFGIGVGVLTRIPFASFYVVLFACLAFANPLYALCLMALYGTSRAVVVAWLSGRQLSIPNSFEELDTIRRLSPLVSYFNGLTLAVVAGCFFHQAFLIVVGHI